MRDLVKHALRCDELAHALETIGEDDGKKPEDYTDLEILGEAHYRLELYYEGGTCHSDMLNGNAGKEDQKIARREVRQLKRFIEKWGELVSDTD